MQCIEDNGRKWFIHGNIRAMFLLETFLAHAMYFQQDVIYNEVN